MPSTRLQNRKRTRLLSPHLLLLLLRAETVAGAKAGMTGMAGTAESAGMAAVGMLGMQFSAKIFFHGM